MATVPTELSTGHPLAHGLTSRDWLVILAVAGWLAALILGVAPRLVGRHQPVSVPASDTIARPISPSKQSESGVVPAAAKAIPAPELTIKNRVINLAGTYGYKYVKLSIAVRFDDPSGKFASAAASSLGAMETAFEGDHPGALAAFNDIITTTVSTRTAAELSTSQGKDALRQELLAKFNQALGGTAHVTYIDFLDFVMQ